MTDPFKGIRLKLERAEAHLNNLRKRAEAFTDTEPYAVRIERDGELFHFFAVDQGVGPVPTDIPLIAGEVAYQLRSSLDHLIHQLVIANGNATVLENSRRHQFPIFKTLDGYKARAGQMIEGVSDEARRRIESCQPYESPLNTAEDDPLWILSDLNNTDKHKLLPVAVVAIGVMKGQDSADGISWADAFTVGGNRTLEHNREFFTARSKTERKMRAKLSCAIALKQVALSQNEPVVPLLTRLVSFVTYTIGGFGNLPEFGR